MTEFDNDFDNDFDNSCDEDDYDRSYSIKELIEQDETEAEEE